MLFSKNKIFNSAINDLFINSYTFELNIFDQFLANKENIDLAQSDIPMLFCSKENTQKEFQNFLKNKSFKNTYIVFNSPEENKIKDKNKALPLDLPLNLRELFHVLQNLIIQKEDAEYHNIKFRKVFLDMVGKHIQTSQASIKLTDKEAKILWHLIKGKGLSISQNFLLKKVWGYEDDIETKTLTTHIYTIRKKINDSIDIFSIENSEGGYYIRFKKS
tara:strand:+ start:1672 stop:2325 length:654 start_codon:yes stop_codon:yes gene_type:complete